MAKFGSKSKLELTMEGWFRVLNVGGYVQEYKFEPGRRFRFDFYFPEARLAVEVEGITNRGGGRHQRPAGFRRDCEKYNLAAARGIWVMRFTDREIRSGRAARQVQQFLQLRKGKDIEQ